MIDRRPGVKSYKSNPFNHLHPIQCIIPPLNRYFAPFIGLRVPLLDCLQ